MNKNENAAARIRIVEKLSLNSDQLQHLEWRLSVPEHKFDCGPRSIWETNGYQPNLFAAILIATGKPIGIVYRSGLPNEINASWWIDSKYRGKGYGSEMVDQLARQLLEEGVTGVGDIVNNTFRGEYDLASQRLLSRLKSRFSG